MIESGEAAPSFTLPAVRDGEIGELSLESFLGDGVVILAFFPGDFNPSCTGSETGLDELDLFTMQKDVTVLAISGDSVHSHRAFAEEYNLHMPLLSDTDGTVAEMYGVAVEDDMAGHLARRAVVVIDHTETVEYTWESDSPDSVPTADEVRNAVEGIGDDETAESRYRVGHAHYIEGRRAFTSAMKAYENREWMMAQTDFTQATEEFEEAGEEFNTAVRFAEGSKTRTYFERAEQKSESLWRAADWLADSASAFASGEGAEAESLRGDAEAPLETARDLHEPPAPDDFPPEEDPGEMDEEESVHPVGEDDEPAATLDANIETETVEGTEVDPSSQPAEEEDEPAGDQPTGVEDEQTGEQPAGTATTEQQDIDGEQPAVEATPASGERRKTAATTESAGGTDRSQDTTAGRREGSTEGTTAVDADEQTTESEEESADEIDDEELEEITAELEEQTETAELSDPEPGGGNDVSGEVESEPAPGTVEDDGEIESEPAPETVEEDGEIDLELTDPTEGDDGDEDSEDGDDADEQEAEGDEDGNTFEDDSGGDHGVPDSL